MIVRFTQRFGAILALVISVPSTEGAAMRVEPFSGALQESWEAFESYRPADGIGPDVFLENPTQVFAGFAFLSHPKIAIYEVNSGSGAYLGSSGQAQAAHGIKGTGLGSTGPILPEYVESASITFARPLESFGGYWGAYTAYLFDPEIIEFQFFDAADNLVGSDARPYTRSFLLSEEKMIFEADGKLLWAGWQFDAPVKRITFGGGFIVADFLQANPIPEPALAALLIAGALCIAPIRRRR
jgi:hypothetical protein